MKYEINWDAFPYGDVYDVDQLNALTMIIGAFGPTISQERYDELPNTYKKYWMPVKEDS